MKQRNWRKLSENLVKRENVPVRRWLEREYGFCGKSGIFCPKVNTPLAFFITAHEVGHFVLKHSGSNKSDCRRELEAWNFALKEMRKLRKTLPMGAAMYLPYALSCVVKRVQGEKLRRLEVAASVSAKLPPIPRIIDDNILAVCQLEKVEVNIDSLLKCVM